MESGHNQGESDQPDDSAGHPDLNCRPGRAACRPPPPAAALGDQAVERILLWKIRVKPPGYEPHQRGHRQKGELHAGAKQVGRIECEHGQPGRGEGIQRQRAAAQKRRGGEDGHQDRRPHGGRAGTGQERVGDGDGDDQRQRPPTGKEHQPRQPPHGPGENAHVESRNRQQVGGARLHEGAGAASVDFLSGPQQEGRGQLTSLRIDVLPEQPAAARAKAVDPASGGHRRRWADHAHAIR